MGDESAAKRSAAGNRVCVPRPATLCALCREDAELGRGWFVRAIATTAHFKPEAVERDGRSSAVATAGVEPL